jgi:negative regulator of sigma-B (phosphoserine phosphatase)
MNSPAHVNDVDTMAEGGISDTVEWSVAARCRPGERTSGDRAVIELHCEETLVAGIDGLGHGAEAAHAAERAAGVFHDARGEDLSTLATRCHRALSGTRGAALSVVRVSAFGVLTWLGIGNVEGRLVSGDTRVRRVKGSLPMTPGIAGHALPRLKAETLDVEPGDVVILATDGVRVGFADGLEVFGSAAAITERVLEESWERVDDALVIAVRYLGQRR